MKKLSAAVLLVGAAVLCGTFARADNLVTNGGFESGSFSGWNLTPASAGSSFFVTSAGGPHSGMYSSGFADYSAGSYDTISQTLTTHAGTLYTLSFYTKQYQGNPSNSDFQALWDGTVVYDSHGGLTNTYTDIVLNETGQGADALSFRAYNTPGIDYLDDVSVSAAPSVAATPEPSSFALLGTGFFGVLLVLRGRRFVAAR